MQFQSIHQSLFNNQTKLRFGPKSSQVTKKFTFFFKTSLAIVWLD